MSTSSPISRYHEVYVHQSRDHPDPLQNQIQVLNEGTGECKNQKNVSSSEPHSRYVIVLYFKTMSLLLSGTSSNHRPPSYIESLIEMDEGVTTRLTEGAPPARISNSRNPRDLPSYDEAMIDPESAPPPTYDSLFFGRVREARKSSKGLMDFAKNVLILLLGTRKYR